MESAPTIYQHRFVLIYSSGRPMVAPADLVVLYRRCVHCTFAYLHTNRTKFDSKTNGKAKLCRRGGVLPPVNLCEKYENRKQYSQTLS